MDAVIDNGEALVRLRGQRWCLVAVTAVVDGRQWCLMASGGQQRWHLTVVVGDGVQLRWWCSMVAAMNNDEAVARQRGQRGGQKCNNQIEVFFH